MSFARRQTKTSAGRHTTSPPKQAPKRAIAFSWLLTRPLPCSRLNPRWVGVFASDTRLASLRLFRISGFEKMLVLYLPLSSGVEIVRIVHGSRDLVAFLRREKL